MIDIRQGGTLGDFAGLQRGTTYKSKLLGTEGPWLLGLACIARNGGFKADNLKTYGGPSDPKILVGPGDILVSLKDVTQAADLLGSVVTVPASIDQGRLTQDTVKLVFDDDFSERKYVYWLLRTPQARDHCRRHATGTTNLGLAREDFLAIEVPPLDEGRELLLQVLQALDDKIELNRRMNETLEAQARALFRDWFVDFGPVKAKMAGDTPYLAPDLWSLFPNRLDDGGVPEGWLSQPLKQHVRVERGLSYKGSGLVEAGEGLPLHNLNSVIEGGGYKQHGLKHYDGDYKPRHRVEVGDVLVANTEQGFDHLLIGFSTLVPAWVGESIFSHHLYKIIPLEGSVLTRPWLHYALSSSPIGERIRRFSNGTTVNMLPKDAFEISEAVIPSEGLIQAFDDFVSSALRRSEKAEDESRTLAQTRDLLLPKLMSGEIRVGDVASEELSAA
ncbi:restriction endonuclease subunit S [Aurantiacibacter flavus]|uniref:Restriction endonuclease subunit S n=1 Tax=Aurantiacibacter flavus TaxID=3145232 RepID=A0ABV0CUR1_9SPHN